MAFDIKTWAKVTVSGNTKAPMLFSYLSADAAATIQGAGYFNSQKSSLKIGDNIYIYSGDSKAQFLRVSAVSPDITTVQIGGDV